MSCAAAEAAPSVVEGRVKGKFRQPPGSTADHGLRTTAGVYLVSATLHAQARPRDTLQEVTRPGRLGLTWRNAQDDLRLIPREERSLNRPFPFPWAPRTWDKEAPVARRSLSAGG